VKQRSRREPRWQADITPNARFGRSKYLAFLVRKYRRTYRQLRRRLRRALYRRPNPALSLNLDLNLYPSLYDAMLAALLGASHQKALTSSFG
jgi:hypothetical protein